jgi:hypothetical protein
MCNNCQFHWSSELYHLSMCCIPASLSLWRRSSNTWWALPWGGISSNTKGEECLVGSRRKTTLPSPPWQVEQTHQE